MKIEADNIKDLIDNYKQEGACILAIKKDDEETCKPFMSGKKIEVLFVFEEIVRTLNKQFPKEILETAFNVAFTEVDSDEDN